MNETQVYRVRLNKTIEGTLEAILEGKIENAPFQTTVVGSDTSKVLAQVAKVIENPSLAMDKGRVVFLIRA